MKFLLFKETAFDSFRQGITISKYKIKSHSGRFGHIQT